MIEILIKDRSYIVSSDSLGTIKNDTFLYQYNKENYCIEYSDVDSKICAIYVSSSGIYYPTSEETFYKEICINNKFEWYKHRYEKAKKHIFIRDIAKYFYLFGLNNDINTIDKTISFLNKETEGYEIVVIGSSGGGYFASVIGAILNAKMVYCFSGFFDLYRANNKNWPLLEELLKKPSCKKYSKVDLLFESGNDTTVYYFYPTKNIEDKQQFEIIKNNKHFLSFGIKNRTHGVCCGEYNVDAIFNNPERLKKIGTGVYSEISFSNKIRGNKSFLKCLFLFFANKYRKIIRKIKHR